jgi:co-chaperonin GroES (HSP10)
MTLTALEQKWEEEKAARGPELDDAYNDAFLDPGKLDEEVLSRIPKPTGWRIAVLPYRGTDKSKGGIVMPEEYKKKTQLGTVCGYVLAVGDLAYMDPVKFPTGAWCKKGDWVIFARYAGARLEIDGGELRILNDDEIVGLVNDPEDILHL